jgi:hypothetical protein
MKSKGIKQWVNVLFVSLLSVSGCGQHGILTEQQSTGSEIWQITVDDSRKSNIYNEVPYCSADSRFFVYLRSNRERELNRTEIILVRIGKWNQHVMDFAKSRSGIAITPGGIFYYWKDAAEGGTFLMRSDLSDPSPERVYRLMENYRIRSLGTISSDNRYYAAGIFLKDQDPAFGILLIDLQNNQHKIIDTAPDIFNSHPQFEPGKGDFLLVQRNRGGIVSGNGRIEQLTGPEGAIYYFLSIPDGKRTDLPVGIPYIPAKPTGHAAWIKDSKEILLTVNPAGDSSFFKGNLLKTDMKGNYKILTEGFKFNHVNVSRCGRFYCCDNVRAENGREKGDLVIGSIETGKAAVLCAPGNSMEGARNQGSHAHAYLSPDLQWVIFQSDRTGKIQIYAASIPEGMLQALEKAD